MVTFSRTQGATRSGKGGSVVADGVDAIVQDFIREAAGVEDRAEKTVVEFAKKAAGYMRDIVPRDSDDTHDSITADPKATKAGHGVYADAGPEHFVARFLEEGTVKMSPRAFVRPAAEKVLPEFESAIKNLSKL